MSLFPGVPNDPQAEFYAGLARALSAAGEGQPQVQPVPSHTPVGEEPPEEKDPRESAIARFAETSGLNPELARRLVHTESSGNPDAVSPKGARGLFQLTPPALQDVGADESVLGDPLKEAEIAGAYARKLREKYGAKSDAELLAAYNAGPSVIGKPPEEWPEETRQYVARILGPEALGPERSPAEEVIETPGEEAQETEEEPGEAVVDEASEPIAETPEGEPVTTGEVEQDPLEAAREVTPDEEEALLSPEDEEHLRKIIESAELTPTQRLGIAILAIQHPEMAMQMLSQAQAGRARAVQAGLNILRERMIGKRMERKQEDMLFRQQVNEFHRRHRELLDQMAKDGIAIPGADKLPEIPANVETPEELESANAALDAWLQAYSAVKTEVNERKEKVTNVQKALNLSRQGGNGSSLIKTLYPKWRDDPELRDAVRQMEAQEQAAAEAQKAEIERLQREGERALKQAQKYDADIRRLQVLAQKDVAVAARETEKTAAEIDAEIAKLADQRMMYEVLASRQWTKAGAKPYEDAITRIDLALDRLRQARARVDTIAATLETGGSLENALRGRGLRDPEEAYKVLDGTITTSRSWQIPGAPKGYTLGWFIDSALKKGNLELVRKYGPAVARKVYQEAYRWTGNPMLAQQLAMKWIQDHTEGAWFFQRPMERFAGEGPLEQQMAEYLNAQTAQQLQGQAQGQE